MKTCNHNLLQDYLRKLQKKITKVTSSYNNDLLEQILQKFLSRCPDRNFSGGRRRNTGQRRHIEDIVYLVKGQFTQGQLARGQFAQKFDFFLLKTNIT